MTDAGFRQMTAYEKSLLGKLVEQAFPGRDELAVQLGNCLVQTIDDDGGLKFRVDTPIRASNVRYSVPAEGETEDLDGGTIHLLLHVADDQIRELEIYKEDGTQITKAPVPAEVRVFVLQ